MYYLIGLAVVIGSLILGPAVSLAVFVGLYALSKVWDKADSVSAERKHDQEEESYKQMMKEVYNFDYEVKPYNK